MPFSDMGKRLNRKHSSLSLARAALLAMPLALVACPDKSEQKAPASPTSATVFKDSPPAAQPPPASPTGTAAAPQASPPPANAARTPEQLFLNLGCKACHGPGSAYATLLANARGKSAETIAMWILEPQKIRPGTMMPNYAGRITTEEALALANWIKAGNPKPSEE
jgi:mono/diheme cytochrome c family protein